MPRRNETKIEIYEDLFIYQNPNGNFYAYVKTETGGRIRKTLKTKDEGKARSRAKELYRDIIHGKHQLKALRISFAQAVTEYIDWVMVNRDDERYTSQSKINMLLLYFGNTQDITTINEKTLIKWFGWRKHFWKTEKGRDYLKKRKVYGGRTVSGEVKATTIMKEAAILRAILRVQKDKGNIPSIPNLKVLSNIKEVRQDNDGKRATFTKEELKDIRINLWNDYRALQTRAARERLNETEGGYIRYGVAMERYRLTTWKMKRINRGIDLAVNLIDATGIRVQEMNKLKWRDLQLVKPRGAEEPTVAVDIRKEVSKVRKRRTVLAIEFSSLIGDKSRLWEKLQQYRALNEERYAVADEDLVFRDYMKDDPMETVQVGRHFSKYIKKEKRYKTTGKPRKTYTKDYYGNEYTLTSIRHSYITRLLQSGVNKQHICDMAGTSNQMIDRFYYMVMPETYYSKIIDKQKEWYADVIQKIKG